MKAARFLYRTHQFWEALTAAPTPGELACARQVLSSPLMELFTRLPASEQAHSLRVLQNLLEQGEMHTDLCMAALLHDVGKSRYPLSLKERVMIVLGKALFPAQVKRWGKGQPRGWRRPFVVAEQHPAWGSEMAAEAGASPLATWLIRWHQNMLPGEAETIEEKLLQRLQLFDDEN